METSAKILYRKWNHTILSRSWSAICNTLTVNEANARQQFLERKSGLRGSQINQDKKTPYISEISPYRTRPHDTEYL